MSSDSVDINRVFEDYYTTLYQARTTLTTIGRVDEFIRRVNLPQLSAEQMRALEAPFTIKEIGLVLASLPLYKAPGPDRLHNELYRATAEVLAGPMLDMFLEAMTLGHLPETLCQADIVLILKKGKNPLSCESYRPITLMNLDVKVWAKMLANRISPMMNSLIHSDQAGFIQGRGVAANLLAVSSLLYNRLPVEDSEAICLKDIAKAFDSLEWPFMWRAMRAFGIGEKFISSVQLLYQGPTS